VALHKREPLVQHDVTGRRTINGVPAKRPGILCPLHTEHGGIGIGRIVAPVLQSFKERVFGCIEP
jgi:hypothetical protein